MKIKKFESWDVEYLTESVNQWLAENPLNEIVSTDTTIFPTQGFSKVIIWIWYNEGKKK